MLLLLQLVACGDASITIGADSPVTVDGPAALDPLYGVPVAFTLSRSDGDAVVVDVRDPAGNVVRTLADGSAWVDTVSWDGRDEAGEVVAPGAYTVRATALDAGETLGEADAPVQVVRVGVTTGTLGGERVGLCWHKAGRAGMYWDGGTDAPTFVLDALDADGAVNPIPAPWDDLFAPPEDPTGANMPAAYAYDAVPTLSLVVGGEIGDAALTARIPGWTLTSGTVGVGDTLVFTADAPLATGPGVVEESLTLEWLAGETVIGTETIPLRVYALLGPPAFEETGLPYAPWVAVIDPALRAIAPVEPTEEAVVSALVPYIYDTMELSYDTRWGASAYTEYDGNTFNNANFDLTSFLERKRGSVVNCTDCAAILEAHANMLGATLSYTILVPDFDLNYIKGIGLDSFSPCPFGGDNCGFSYHAVTTPDHGDTIYDATLLLDGDDDPGSSPSTELYVQAIAGDEYLDRLVLFGNVRYLYTQKESLQ